MVDSAMIGRSPRWKVAVLVTSLCVCGADLAVCAAAGDVVDITYTEALAVAVEKAGHE
jgi:hypothetical protein